MRKGFAAAPRRLVPAACALALLAAAPPADFALEGSRLYARGELREAITLLRQGVAAHPESPQLHFMLANGYFRAEEWPLAIHHYTETTRLRPGYADAHLNLGFACYRSQRFQEGVRAWSIAVHQTPRDSLPVLALVTGLLAEGRREAAAQMLERAEALESGWASRMAGDVRWTPGMVAAVEVLAAELGDSPGPGPRR